MSEYGRRWEIERIAQLRADARSKAGDVIDLAFHYFHQANPVVYRKLVFMARELRGKGHKTIGIGMLFEVLRWQHALETTDAVFKLNNNHRSRYARLIMSQEHDLCDIFTLRELADTDPPEK